ncbi:LEAF RUST 10 DISEASE-RESISTANCE LOCUS RECEPTOR-LIKE PROTEIN KINASE-like 1.3, partial [Bienertia sinuspersici]
MNSYHLHSFPSKIIWSITFLAILCFPICFSNDLEWYDTCGNYFSCGNVTHVGFPFWGGSYRPKQCGYPDLELSCKNNITTILQIKGMKYHVLDINQNTRIMKLARDDFLHGICMQKFVNTTLDFELFDYAPGSQNLTVLYGCPPPYTPNPSQFTCKISGTNDTDGYPVEGAIGPSGCHASVVVPVVVSSAVQIGKWSLSQIISHGFEATYKLEDAELCAQCEASRGRCGFDLSQDMMTCLCSDGSVTDGNTLCNGSTNPATAYYKMQSQFSSSLSVVILIIFILLISFVTFTRSNDEHFLNCSQPFDCGSIRNLSYPFWGENRASYCGIPEFKLHCQDNKIPTITISSQKYRILAADVSAHKLTVARADFWDDLCPSSLVNTNITDSHFELALTSSYLTLFYGCPLASMTRLRFPKLDVCRTNDVFLDSEMYNGPPIGCKNVVNIPILKTSYLEQGINTSVVLGVLHEGFELQWKVNDEECCKCVESGGQCGIDPEQKFSCFCADKPCASNCSTWSVYCSNEHSMPEISQTTESSEIYYLLCFSPESHTISVAREDYYGFCPANLSDTILNFNLFDYTSADKNVTLFYECSAALSVSAYPFSCTNLTNGTSNFMTKVLESNLGNNPPDICKRNADEYDDCKSPFLCGNVSLSYPFYDNKIRPENCGYPGFEVECDDGKDFPEISLAKSSEKYYLLNINSDSHTISVAREDLQSNYCAESLQNTTLDTTLYRYSSNVVNVTLYYDCSNIASLPNPYYPFSCTNGDNSRAYYIPGTNANYYDPTTIPCKSNIYVLVNQSSAAVVRDEDSLQKAFRESFALEWYADNTLCDDCQGSGGVCGYNTSQDSAYADDGKYEICKRPFQCGYVSNISYPFYDGVVRPDYCGYPGFQLNCSSSSPQRSVSRRQRNYWHSYCPKKPHNTVINTTLFSYITPDENITLYYECSNASTPVTNSFSCPNLSSNGRNKTGYFVTKDLESRIGNNIPWNTCNRSIVVPIINYESSVQRIRDTFSLMAAFRYGFELEWNAENNLCEECSNSGGECGYNSTMKRFTCYCPDQPYATKCPGVSIAGFLVAAVLACGSIFLVRRRKQSRALSEAQSKDLEPSNPTTAVPSSNGYYSSQGYTTSPSTYLSPSIPSYPSSKSDFEKSADYFGVKVFSYNELEEATENFNESRELGDGGFGTVYYVAVKRLYENSCRHMGQFLNEIHILARLRHKNLVALYGCTSRKSRELLLVYEYVPNGTVADHLHGKLAESNVLPWFTRLSIAVETAEALTFLHENDVIHRDVKTTNILLENCFRVKVADFGLSRLFPNDVTHVSTAPQGTPGYVDPEYYQCYQLTEKSDVYSFGVVLAELISSKVAVDITRHRHDINLANMAVDRIQKHALDELIDPKLGCGTDFLGQKMMKLVAEVAFQCLQQDKDARPSMKEVLESLKGIQKEMENAQKQVVVDIHECDDDVGLLKNVPPPLSPETE